MLAAAKGGELGRRPQSYRAELRIPAAFGARGVGVMRRPCSKCAQWCAAILAGALAAAVLGAAPVRAGGLVDFLFGPSHDQQPPPPPPEYYAEPPAPIGPVAPAPFGPESVRQGAASTGRVVAYCVRLCDGEHFPLGHMTNATPVETCRAMCPASKTKVFFGSDIGAAVARDGARYADLDTAFIYRKQLVAPLHLQRQGRVRPGAVRSVERSDAAAGRHRVDQRGPDGL